MRFSEDLLVICKQMLVRWFPQSILRSCRGPHYHICPSFGYILVQKWLKLRKWPSKYIEWPKNFILGILHTLNDFSLLNLIIPSFQSLYNPFIFIRNIMQKWSPAGLRTDFHWLVCERSVVWLDQALFAKDPNRSLSAVVHPNPNRRLFIFKFVNISF